MRPGARASILHVDLDAFYAQVEQLKRPELRGRPVLVGGGVVLSASYEARRFGVAAPMGVRRALALCPGAVVVSGSFSDYLELSGKVFDVCRRFTPLVEPISIDEAFLDVSGSEHLLGPAPLIAAELKASVRRETGLVVSVGVARTKFLAKVAGRVSKPDGLLVVDPAAELDFLHPLPVEAIWGVGPALAARLHARGVETVGDLAGLPEHTLVHWLGPGAGRHLLALAWNRDPRPVVTGRRAGSVGSQQALGRGTADRAALSGVLLRLCDRVGTRLRSKQRTARAVTVRVRGEIGQVLSRRATSPVPLASTAAIQALALPLLEAACAALAHPVTLVGVTLSGLDREGPVQLELPLERGAPHRPGSSTGAARLRLDGSTDEIRRRYGKGAVTRASSLLAGRGAVPDEFRELAERDDRD